MKMILASVVAFAAVGAVPAFAEEAAPETGKIVPESAVLPANVVRFRAIYGASWGDYGFDKDGKKVETGVSASGQGGAAVLEYGITNKISGQFLMPFKAGAKLEVADEAKFSAYVGDKIKASLFSSATLKSLYDSNTPAPVAIPVGALGTISAGVPVKTYIDAAITQAVAAQKKVQEDAKFATGIGDIEVGAKYSVSTLEQPLFEGVPVYGSVAGGLRLPTGEFLDAQKDGKAVNGRGTLDGALRLNLDVKAIQGVVVSFENQSEMMVMKGKSWNGTKEVDFERDGVRNVGYGKIVIAPGAWVPALDVLSITPKYNYNYEMATKTDGTKQDSSLVEQSQSFTTSVGLNGFVYGLPLQLDVDYTMPLSGKNQAMATSSLVGTLKAFYKF